MSSLNGISVILDLDGTLVDSEPNHYHASRQVLAEHGVPDFSWTDHERYVGISTAETVADWRERYGLTVPADQLLAATNSRYLSLARASTPAYPQMRALVELLAADGVPMAVASGSSPGAIEAILAGTGLDAHLRTRRRGPARQTRSGRLPGGGPRLGAPPADCVVLEDAAPGAAAAHAAGMRCIALPHVGARADDPAFVRRICFCRAARRSSPHAPPTTGCCARPRIRSHLTLQHH